MALDRWGLTAREFEVLRLVADNRSNRRSPRPAVHLG
jgi:DNA-binding CsgD family transcriptional regulator